MSRSGVGLVLQSPTCELMEQAVRLSFPTTNNDAKYEAIHARLDLTLMLVVAKLEVKSDLS